MKKLLPLLICLIFISQISNGQIVSKEVAKTVATNFMAKKKNVSIKRTTFSEEFIISRNSEPFYYAFNVNDNGGFIIVSADESAFPIIAYNTTGRYENNPENQPIQFKEWMENCVKMIQDERKNENKANNPNKEYWNFYLNELPSLNVETRATVAPLLGSITWNQNQGWNKYAPYDAQGPGSHAFSGCVATATCQVLKFWHHPRTGYGSFGYTDLDTEHYTGAVDTCAYGYLSTNFATKTYDYTKMPNSAPSDASARLLSDVGIGLRMNYCHSGSGATTADVATVLKTNLYYNTTTVKYVTKSAYTTTNWNTLLKTEFNAGRPCVYKGDGSGGHAFVCDGYDDNYTGLGLHYHFNWGWTGSNDGYYLLTDLTPGSHIYTNNQAAVIGIKPLTTKVPYSDFIMSSTDVDADISAGATSIIAGNTLSLFDQSTYGPTIFKWAFQGGTPATSTAKNPKVVYSSPGTYTINLVATNAKGAGSSITKTIIVLPNTQLTAPASCIPTTNTLSSYRGIKSFKLNTIENYTGTSSQDNWYYGGNGYLDFSSKISTNLNANTTYNYTINVGCETYKEYYAIYIDYNNDGDFSDTYEEVFKSTTMVSGAQTASFKTIASPLLNTPLRLRVISSYAPIVDACNSVGYPGQIINGQAEDYAVNFKTTISTRGEESEETSSIEESTSGIQMITTQETISIDNANPSEISEVTTYNVLGEIISSKKFTGNCSLDLPRTNGSYIIVIKNSTDYLVKKINVTK